MPNEEKEKLMPGDKGYPGGSFDTLVYVNGKAKNAHVVKDSEGNVVFTAVTDKLFGIF